MKRPMAADHFPPGTRVTVTSPVHWLFENEGVVVPTTAATKMLKAHVGALNLSIDIAVDFGERYKAPIKGAFGERMTHTHNCDGAMLGLTGYFMKACDLTRIDELS